jgi:hypothetical protein
LKKALKSFIKIGIPLVLGVLLVLWSYFKFTTQQLEEIKSHFIQADYRFIAIGMILALLSHLSRAWRWNYMLQPLGYQPRFIHNIIAIGTGYAMNILIPRSGELSRAVILNRTDNIPVNKSLGTIIAERVIDFVLLLAITISSIVIAGPEIGSFFEKGMNDAFAKADSKKIILYLAVLVLILIVVGIVIKKVNLGHKLKGFYNGVKEGIATIWTMKKKWPYLLHTALIWTLYLLMFYVSLLALPNAVFLPLESVLIAFVAGSFAVAFTNGGFGAYPYLIAQVLLIYGLPETEGTSIGWILWLSQTILVLFYGLVSFLILAFKGK